MRLPNEVLFIIFKQFSSHTALYQYSLVCQQWYKVATATTFYTDITIHTLAQFVKFLETAGNMKRNNKPVGHCVRRLTLLFETKIKTECFSDLKQHCPFITTIQVPLIQLNIGNHDDFFLTLGHISTIKLLKENNDAVVIHYYIKETTSNDNMDLIAHNISAVRGGDNGVTIMAKKYTFYTDINQHQFLTELCLNFYYVMQPVNFFNLDTIHTKYPHLSKLTMIHFDFNHPLISEDYRLREKQFKKLRSFRLQSCTIDHPFIFFYITKRYPKLKSLEMLDIDCDSKSNTFSLFQGRVEEDFFNMFTNFVLLSSSSSRLKTFKLKLSNTIHWPNDRLMEWIYQHQQELYLKSLTWPTTFMISKELLNSPLFLLHLQSFEFELSDTTWEIFKSYLNEKKEKKKSPSQDKEKGIDTLPLSFNLKTLRLSFYPGGNKLNINVFDLIDLFPKLTTLKLNQLFLNANKDDDDIMHDQEEYSLQKLIITNCKLEMENIFTKICYYCSQLQVLHCISSSMYYTLDSDLPKTPLLLSSYSSLPSSSKEIKYDTLFLDAPHIKLEELKIKNLNHYLNNNSDDLFKYRYLDINVTTLPYLDQKTKTFQFKNNEVNNHIHFYNHIRLNTVHQFYYNSAWIMF
ncbi:unnamed protein product [Cunninghamella blakesleeana]